MDFETFLEIFPLKNIIIYLVVINIVGFLAMFIDKEKAKRGAWRIPEKTLLLLSFIAGAFGVLAAFWLTHHKIRKKKLYICVFSLALVYFFLVLYWIGDRFLWL